MSGHNRWSKVKNIKGPLDAKRGKLFTKISKELIVAAKAGGGNPDGNARLRTAIANARAASMPKDKIELAIKKGTGEVQSESIEETVYEGYGPGGIAMLIETASDNKNRTVNELRTLFKIHGGNLGEGGSVAWMFFHHGQLLFDPKAFPEDKVMEVALEAGAQDVINAGDVIEVLTGPTDLYHVRDVFEKVGFHPTSCGFSYVAKTTVPSDKTTAEKTLAFIDEIEDRDDVQKVHSNIEVDDATAEALAGK